MKIAFFEAEKWEEEYLRKKLTGTELIFSQEPLTLENVSQFKDCEGVSVFICSVVTKEVLEQLPHLKVITTRSTGVDHIDLGSCKKKNIPVLNVPHYGTHTVAEHTFALILALSRKLFSSIERTKRGEFDHKDLTGFDLYGKTIGIVGLGDIGKSVIAMAKGFGMRVVAYSRHPDESLARKLGVTFLDLKELLAVADIVTLHVPYTKETHNMINKKNIKKFKKGSVLINTARGGLIETEALMLGLELGILAGVGLDVLEDENSIKEERQLVGKHCLNEASFKTLYYDHVLMKKENVIITPHNAFNSTEALRMILDVTAGNILDFQQGKMENTV